MKKPLHELLEFLMDNIDVYLKMFYHPDCCIAATRITLHFLEHFRIPCKPICTRLLVLNNNALEHLHKYGDLGDSPERIQEAIKNDCYAVAIGAENPTNIPTGGVGLAGHLVAFLPGPNILVDPSLSQASRPQKGIVTAPMFFEIVASEEELKTNFVSLLVSFRDEPPMLLRYEMIENDRYLQSPNWDDILTNQIADQLIRKATRELGFSRESIFG